MATPLEAALAAEAAGISVLPPKQNGTKAPDSYEWTSHQRKRATADQIQAWYAKGRTGVGWVVGRISGKIEVIDFDDRSSLAEFRRLVDEAGLSPLLKRVEAGYFEHSPNGAHLMYRCETIDGNKPLARRPLPPVKGKPKYKPLIETRGEGGFIVVAPSHGSVNASGNYEMVSGSIETIQTITPDERTSLHNIARILDESITPVDAWRPSQDRDDRPGDDFNERSSWGDVLEPSGWVRVSSRLGQTNWRRPGKDRGVSATVNYAGSDLLYIFSTSTEFDSERGFSKFSAYSIINHNGDFAEAARELSLKGYGATVTPPDDEVDLSALLASSNPHKSAAMTELLRVPGLVGELAMWINASSIKPQPILALGASVCAMSTILGRKVMTQTGLRTNIYALGVGETGCGKERARQAIGRLYQEVECGRMVGDSFASDSAIEVAVAANPSSLYLIDEIGHFLGLIRSETTPGYIRAIIPVFLRMYSASEGIYRRKTYADSEKNEEPAIENPCLSIYGTTVPANLYGSLQRSNLSDGLLSRFLVFESDDPDPHVQITDAASREPPAALVDGFKRWAKSDGAGGNLNPDPLEVEATPDAWRVFDALELRMRDKRRQVRLSGGDQGPYTRVWATAQKLALIRACGIRAEPEVTEADAQWGADLTWTLTERFMDRVGDRLAENRIEANVQRIAEIVRQAGSGGVTKNRLTRNTQSIARRERDDAIATLIESGQILANVTSPSSGRPKTTYVKRQ